MIPITPRLDFAPSLNFARAYLFRAADCLGRDDLIGAGCCLREACHRQLSAELEWFGVEVKGGDKRSPVAMLRALKRAGHCSEGAFEIVKECIDFGNKLAHCRRVKPSYLRAAIQLMHEIIDSQPCNEPVNMPGLPTAPEPSIWPDADPEEFDPCDWWKPDGWQFGEGGGA